MIEYDEMENRMILKVVYYGPALSGKTTNLMRLHDVLAKEHRGDLMILDTRDDRTLYFDLLPFFFVAPSGLKIKLKVYTVPGQVQHDATRKAVLARADGVVFVADSQIKESANNFESFDNLEKNLAIVGLDIDRLPLVIQFNKRDLDGTVTEAEIARTWEATGLPVHTASALYGQGVEETFSHIVERIYNNIDARFHLCTAHGLNRDDFVQRITTI